jgi:hypothetical protein
MESKVDKILRIVSALVVIIAFLRIDYVGVGSKSKCKVIPASMLRCRYVSADFRERHIVQIVSSPYEYAHTAING